MKKTVLLITILSLYSCSFFEEKGIDFKIINNSNQAIENITFTTSERFDIKLFDKIESNQSVEGFLSMKNNNQDGSYYIEFKNSNDSIVSEDLGYYSNGTPSNEWVKITIMNDTIIKKFSKGNGY